MGRANRRSNGKDCEGVFRSTEKCKRARDESGNPVVMNRKCPDCLEWRCKKHCRCFRQKTSKSKGRSAPRGPDVPKTTQRTPVASAAPARTVVQAPVGRSSAHENKLLSIDEWWRQCRADVNDGDEVELSSYRYDDPELQKIVEGDQDNPC